MATNSSPITNLSGLSSGIDTNALVTQLVAMRKQPAVLLNSQISLIDARKNSLQGASNVLTALKTAAADLISSSLWTASQSIGVSNNSVLTSSRTGSVAAGGYMISVSTLARAEQQRASASFSSAGSDDTLHISVGGAAAKDVAISSGDSLETIAGKINQTSDIGAYASVVDGRLYLASKTTGAANTISITSDSGLAGDMGWSTHSAASDAAYTVNGGVTQYSSSNTVKDAIPGLTLVFKQTGDSGITAGDASISADAVADKLQAFVDAYNKAGKSLKSAVTEQPVKNPGTAAERVKGSMFNDRTLQTTLSELRTWTSHVNTNSGTNTLTKALGISTQGAGAGVLSTDGPQLVFNRQQFLDAYASDPTKVRQMVSSVTGDATSEGLAQWAQRRLDGLIGSSGVVSTALKGQDSQRTILVDRQERINQRASVYETFLRRQYTQMESVLGNLQSQNNQLSGQIRAMNQ